MHGFRVQVQATTTGGAPKPVLISEEFNSPGAFLQSQYIYPSAWAAEHAGKAAAKAVLAGIGPIAKSQVIELKGNRNSCFEYVDMNVGGPPFPVVVAIPHPNNPNLFSYTYTIPQAHIKVTYYK